MATAQKPTSNHSSALAAIIVLLGVAFSAATGLADIGDRVTITTKSGATYTGTIVAESASEISVLTEPDKIKVTIPKDLISEIKILEPKHEEKTETQAPETPMSANQYMASLAISSFSLALKEGLNWGLTIYARVNPSTFSGISLGAGYGYAQSKEASFYRGMQIKGELYQDLLFLAVGSGHKQNFSVILGLYSASSESQGRQEFEPDCFSTICYNRWTEADISIEFQGPVFGVVSDTNYTVSGLWIVLNPKGRMHGSIHTCHEALGCSKSGIIDEDMKLGIIWGSIIGIGLRW